MKVVVVRSPKALRGILRLLFGIKKQDMPENKNIAYADTATYPLAKNNRQ
ncbi:MAG: stage V sporulation protein SpoVM [Clostridia bacterium]|nr:stage V sporulation protein SpoVM [Clostridia bacterium]